MAKIVIGGDLVPTSTNLHKFISGDIKEILDEGLLNILHSSDFRIFNLEVPLINVYKPIKKHGPNLIAPSDSINAIEKLKPSVLCLANNHILDQGEQGLFSTTEILKEKEIFYIGAGKDILEASKPIILNNGNEKIGIYACAEHEFSIATEATAGANPFDPLNSFDHIAQLRSQCDYLIVLYHGGKEHYRYPSPYLQKVCRKMVDKGADLIVCQHSHCIGCEENYKGSKIIYGQGNFIFNKNNNEFWNTGLLLIIDSIKRKISYIFFETTDVGIKLCNIEKTHILLTEFLERSEKIKDPKFLQEQYSILAQEYLLIIYIPLRVGANGYLD